MRSPSPTLLPVLLAALAGCSTPDDGSAAGAPACPEGRVPSAEGCRLDPYRYEPAEPADLDNVRYYSSEALELLDLPLPPKSGFRIVMEPQYVEPGEDTERCQSWQIPDLTHRWVYTAELHASPGLHHANLYGLAIDPLEGEQPHPGCRGRADGRIFGQLSTVIAGQDTSDLIVPTVLFANSTQVYGRGAEKYALSEGYALELVEGLEIMTDTHLQNTSPERIRVEAAWDFYTMPADRVTNPTVMFVYLFLDFLIPPRTRHTLSSTCNWAGGDVAALMPHTHQWATGFDVSFGSATMRAHDDMPEVGGMHTVAMTPYDIAGTGLSDSDIVVYDPPVDTDGTDAVRFQCHLDNTTDHDMCFGIGENEMCFLFGYVHPPESQRVGLVLTDGASCLTLDPAERGRDRFDMGSWLGTQPEDVRRRVVDRYVDGKRTCPYSQ